jgi:hypothetical protein
MSRVERDVGILSKEVNQSNVAKKIGLMSTAS